MPAKKKPKDEEHRILVTGSRTWKNRKKIYDVLSDVIEEIDQEPYEGAVTLVVGDAAGADDLAVKVADDLDYDDIEVWPAKWDEYGKKAGIIRNIEMLDSKPSRVIAFWDGVSKGTEHTIREAEKRGIPLRVIIGKPSDLKNTKNVEERVQEKLNKMLADHYKPYIEMLRDPDCPPGQLFVVDNREWVMGRGKADRT